MSESVLTEVEAANFLRFPRFATFRRALGSGAVPGPDIQLPDGPRWRIDTLRAFLGGTTAQLSEHDALERLKNGQDPD